MAGNGQQVGTFNGTASSASGTGGHARYDLSDAARLIDQLHRHVTATHRRVEIVRAGDDGGDDVCVLISKSELDCLERALDILGDSDAVKELCGELALLTSRDRAVASSTTPPL